MNWNVSCFCVCAYVQVCVHAVICAVLSKMWLQCVYISFRCLGRSVLVHGILIVDKWLHYHILPGKITHLYYPPDICDFQQDTAQAQILHTTQYIQA